ncbi:Zn-ribbon domain-containing OB-fold protein [Nocardia sp. bgisy134]|uniref:Zn-ribbon domain-containing OB-fold protein n=1 Tax=unclassified Nocardia TaxID=2637762 RepID=UPI003D73E801
MYSPDPENTGSVGDANGPRVADTLMIRRCTRCEKLFAPLTADCSFCAADSLEWVPSSGAGSIVSWRVVERAATGVPGGLMPLTIAIVELEEGPWVYTSIEGEVPALASRPVRVQFQPCPWEDRFPVFTVDADSRSSGDQRRSHDRIGARSEKHALA